MPYRIFNIEEVSAYLHLNRADVEKLVKDQEIPFQIRRGKPVFGKQEIDTWASQRILGLRDRPLSDFHSKSSDETRQFFREDLIIPELMEPHFIAPALKAKTKASVIRSLVELAEQTERVYDARELLESVEAREELCPTALPGGLALLHARHQQQFMFESSFVVLGRTFQDIHFGAPNAEPSDLFFLICCQEDRIHLHTLARICMMAQKTEMLSGLRAAEDAHAMYDCLIASETEVMEARKTPPKR